MSDWTLHLAFSAEGLAEACSLRTPGDRIVVLWAASNDWPKQSDVYTLAPTSSDRIIDDTTLAAWCIAARAVVSWR